MARARQPRPGTHPTPQLWRAATALTDIGAVTEITVDTAGDGYLTNGMKKFVDDLPVTCTPANATSFTTGTLSRTAWWVRVRATNVIGASGWSTPVLVADSAAAPTSLTATLQAGPQVRLSWRDNATNESGFVVQRSADAGVTYTTIATPGARSNTGTISYTDTGAAVGSSYVYRVMAVGSAGNSAPSNTVTVPVLVPGTPRGVTGTVARQGNNERITVRWGDVLNETGYTIQWSATQAFTTVAGSGTAAANATSYTTGRISRTTWWVRVRATNVLGTSGWSTPQAWRPPPDGTRSVQPAQRNTESSVCR